MPPDSAVSYVAALFYQSLGMTSIGIAYVNDPYGIAFKDGVFAAAESLGMRVYGAQYEFISSTSSSIDTALETIKEESEGAVNAFVGVALDGVDLCRILKKAGELGMAGQGNMWTWTDGVTSDHVQDCQEEGLDDLALGSFFM